MWSVQMRHSSITYEVFIDCKHTEQRSRHPIDNILVPNVASGAQVHSQRQDLVVSTRRKHFVGFFCQCVCLFVFLDGETLKKKNIKYNLSH